MTRVASTPSETARPLATPEESESKLTGSEPSIQHEVAASELLLVLGEAYFKLPELTRPSDRNDGSVQVQPLRIDPQVLAKASPPFSAERDFWQDVAILSDRYQALPSYQLGVKSDPVAYAIATVSAAYTLQTSEQRLTSKNHNVGSPLPARPPLAPTKDAAAPEASGSKTAPPAEPDLTDALLSLFGFEQTAAIGGAKELDAVVITETRLRAAGALVAAGVNRNSALKAAQGRKG